jgi:hypothetical protein
MLFVDTPMLLRSVCLTIAMILQSHAENVNHALKNSVLDNLMAMAKTEQPDNVMGPILEAIRSIVSTNGE